MAVHRHHVARAPRPCGRGAESPARERLCKAR